MPTDRALWTQCSIPTGQRGTIIGMYQDRIGGDMNYFIRYVVNDKRVEEWFNEHEVKDI